MFSAQRKDSVCSHAYVLGVIDLGFRYNFFKVAVDPQATGVVQYRHNLIQFENSPVRTVLFVRSY